MRCLTTAVVLAVALAVPAHAEELTYTEEDQGDRRDHARGARQCRTLQLVVREEENSASGWDGLKRGGDNR